MCEMEGHAAWAVCGQPGEPAARLAARALPWVLGSIAEGGDRGAWADEMGAQRRLLQEVAGPTGALEVLRGLLHA